MCKLQLPTALEFGCVPAKEQVQQQLPIKNVGDAPLRFAWKIGAPFAILPAAGQLAPGQTLTCQVLFDPQEAAAYRAAAACSLDNGELLCAGGCQKKF
ncbi:hypothetical protein COO60DRAFT_1662608 [Scenedesmus sp. NREL 46B-D3]|nr:hypothetical protein COO60DRAFT_1662608 [Scenedesmus sp. NREL 46B-D3]